MNIWKEVRETLLNFGAVFITKIEILTRMAKCKIAIRNKESEIDKMRIEIGDYTIMQIEQKEIINEEVISFKIKQINEIRKEIEQLSEEYNIAKEELINSNRPDKAANSGKEKQAE